MKKNSFITLTPWINAIKLFPVQNMEQIVRDKHSSLLRKFVNYKQKEFYNIGARAQCYKLFQVFKHWNRFLGTNTLAYYKNS
jgi:hypothetical protein